MEWIDYNMDQLLLGWLEILTVQTDPRVLKRWGRLRTKISIEFKSVILLW